ncbi:MAG: SDR family oxidoreductase [Candidatus Aminicenantales bacterium]
MVEVKKTEAKKTRVRKSNLKVAGRVALVTAATSLLGRATAVKVAPQVEAVAIHYHRLKKAANEIAEEIRKQGRQAKIFGADLSLPGEPTTLIRQVERIFGRVDILVNNFGPFLEHPWKETTAEEWLNLYRDNVGVALELIKAVLPGMRSRGWGRIINFGFHRAGQMTAFPRILAYAAAKTALLLLTRTAAQSEAPFGITVNMVSPGLVEGGKLPHSLKKEGAEGAKVSGKPADVAEAVAFLASDKAAAITGVNLIVAGTWKM